MTHEFVLSNLCYYDLRNPNGVKHVMKFSYEEEEIATFGRHAKPDCACDNCFYGRTELAEHIIKLDTCNQEKKLSS